MVVKNNVLQLPFPTINNNAETAVTLARLTALVKQNVKANDSVFPKEIDAEIILIGKKDVINKKANEFGLENTHFVTPHGLDREEHYTTAYELAKITDYALQNKKIAETDFLSINLLLLISKSRTDDHTYSSTPSRICC